MGNEFQCIEVWNKILPFLTFDMANATVTSFTLKMHIFFSLSLSLSEMVEKYCSTVLEVLNYPWKLFQSNKLTRKH